jgi:hypothetical protein
VPLHREASPRPAGEAERSQGLAMGRKAVRAHNKDRQGCDREQGGPSPLTGDGVRRRKSCSSSIASDGRQAPGNHYPGDAGAEETDADVDANRDQGESRKLGRNQ